MITDLSPEHGFPRTDHAAMSPQGRAVSRRAVILGGAGLVATMPIGLACSSRSEPSIPQDPSEGGSLIAAFPQGAPHVPVGVPTRLPYLLTDAEGIPLDLIEGDVRFVIAHDDTEVAELDVSPRSEGIPRAYLPLQHTFDSVGIHDVTATYQGKEMTSQIQVFPQAEVVSPVVGQQLPAAPTATDSNSLEVDPICTQVPQCPFHSVSLTDALGQGKSIVLLVATPAYCQTSFCGPTLGNLMDMVNGRDDLTVIHSEVYKNPKAAKGDLAAAPLAPLPEKYDLLLEPVLYVTDAKGTITTRADATIDRSEMAEVIG